MLARLIYAFIVAVLAALVSATPSSAAESPCPSVLDYQFVNLMDEPVSLCQFRGKVLLIVNTASECGYTPQYEALEKLYRRYRDKGFVVLGFWDFQRTISVARNRGRIKRSRNSAG